MTQRVKKPDRDDWGKLSRVLEYLNGTRHMKQMLEVENLSTLNWFIDASHQVHIARGTQEGCWPLKRGLQPAYAEGKNEH